VILANSDLTRVLLVSAVQLSVKTSDSPRTIMCYNNDMWYIISPMDPKTTRQT